jgi:hypothetical protein
MRSKCIILLLWVNICKLLEQVLYQGKYSSTSATVQAECKCAPASWQVIRSTVISHRAWCDVVVVIAILRTCLKILTGSRVIIDGMR